MNIDTFHALKTGTIDGHARRVVPLGTLRVPSGRLEASDPFVNLGEGVVIAIPPGDYPAAVTIVDVSDEQDGSHLRESHLSVILAEGLPVRVAGLMPEGATRPPAEDEAPGVPVDAGTVGFADADAIPRCMPEDDWYDGVFDTGQDGSWFALMDDENHYIDGSANIVFPLAQAGENVVLAHSGWGDGFYPVVGTYDAAGRLLAVHIDLQLVDGEDDDDEDEAEPEPEQKPGFWGRLFGRG
ncbi:MAG: DUF4241 domain-containing protein [Arachnia sp.]